MSQGARYVTRMSEMSQGTRDVTRMSNMSQGARDVARMSEMSQGARDVTRMSMSQGAKDVRSHLVLPTGSRTGRAKPSISFHKILYSWSLCSFVLLNTLMFC